MTIQRFVPLFTLAAFACSAPAGTLDPNVSESAADGTPSSAETASFAQASSASTIRTVKCESLSFRDRECDAGGPVLEVVGLNRPASSCRGDRFAPSEPNPNNTFGYHYSRVWVRAGCRAEFVVRIGSHYEFGGGHGSYDYCSYDDEYDHYDSFERRSAWFLCESKNYSGRHCELPAKISRILDVDQVSSADCHGVRDHATSSSSSATYGFEDNDIWVRSGCRAWFRVRLGDPFDDASEHNPLHCKDSFTGISFTLRDIDSRFEGEATLEVFSPRAYNDVFAALGRNFWVSGHQFVANPSYVGCDHTGRANCTWRFEHVPYPYGERAPTAHFRAEGGTLNAQCLLVD